MRIRERSSAPEAEGDLTPMIDMTFQLIAFFMVLINFTETAQDQRVTLPESELAKPPDEPYEDQLTVQLTGQNLILFAGEEMSSLEKFSQTLLREKQVIQLNDNIPISDVTVIIRGDQSSLIGKVQEIMQACQKAGFENFALRGKQAQVQSTPPPDA